MKTLVALSSMVAIFTIWLVVSVDDASETPAPTQARSSTIARATWSPQRIARPTPPASARDAAPPPQLEDLPRAAAPMPGQPDVDTLRARFATAVRP